METEFPIATFFNVCVFLHWWSKAHKPLQDRICSLLDCSKFGQTILVPMSIRFFFLHEDRSYIIVVIQGSHGDWKMNLVMEKSWKMKN